jgi:hypothetical protein
MDDSDAVVAQIGRTMVATGDRVTSRLDDVALLEKPPLYYWPMRLTLAALIVEKGRFAASN